MKRFAVLVLTLCLAFVASTADAHHGFGGVNQFGGSFNNNSSIFVQRSFSVAPQYGLGANINGFNQHSFGFDSLGRQIIGFDAWGRAIVANNNVGFNGNFNFNSGFVGNRSFNNNVIGFDAFGNPIVANNRNFNANGNGFRVVGRNFNVNQNGQAFLNGNAVQQSARGQVGVRGPRGGFHPIKRNGKPTILPRFG